MANDPNSCQHENFDVEAHTNRVVLPETQKVAAILLAMKITCRDCGSPFWFPGCGTGTSYIEPCTSTDGFQLIAPVVQANKRNLPDPSLPSVTIRNNDNAKGYTR